MAKRATIAAGDRFARLTVLEEAAPRITEQGNKSRMFQVQCDCGTIKTVRMPNLIHGKARSCGCLRADLQRGRPRAKAVPTGLSRTTEYAIWSQMLARCRRPHSQDYEHYGARGVTVCDRWLQLENFLQDMGPRPSPKHSIDRIDNDGHYCKTNCRWATTTEQQRNKRGNHMVTVDGVSRCLAEWAELTGIQARLLWARINDLGWSDAEAVMTPTGRPRRQTWPAPALAA